jgi:hypothetical protein
MTRLDLWYILKMEPTGFANDLEVRFEGKRRVKHVPCCVEN